MTNLRKVVLLSVFAYPGTGHLVLREYPTAAFIITIFSALLYTFVQRVMDKLAPLVQLIKEGELALNGQAISDYLAQSGQQIDLVSANLIAYSMLLIWIIAIVDSYRLAKKESSTHLS
ncbi:MAG: hypothetical protein HRU25_09310 [Psychrobium sp.]|nr:hypothetical protein [Psychrobium sp.]